MGTGVVLFIDELSIDHKVSHVYSALPTAHCSSPPPVGTPLEHKNVFKKEVANSQGWGQNSWSNVLGETKKKSNAPP